MPAPDNLVFHRPVLNRAGIACVNCRSKKVRCNVSEGRAPCARCKRLDLCCSVKRSKRGRKSRHLPTNESAHPQLSPIQNIETRRRQCDSEMRSEGNALDHRSEEPITHVYQVVDHDHLHQQLSYASLITGLSQAPTPISHTTPPISLVANDENILTPAPSSRILPEYIDDLADDVSSEALQFLWLKGALTLPDEHLRNALVDCFVEYVHFTMPVVDLEEFLGALHDPRGTSRPRVSCLLFQAVMFSAVSYVDLHILLNAGFASRRAARKLFHERAKLLYDLDAENRPFVHVQALALLSHCTEFPAQVKEGWHWLGIAVSTAYSLGLHQARPCKPDDRPVWRQARRIWWTLYVRDRQQAQYLSRPMRIRDNEFDTPRLTLDDFELDSLEEIHLPQVPFTSRKTMNRSIQAIQATIFINMTKLCSHIGHVLTMHYSMLSWKKSLATSENLYPTPPTAGNMRSMRPEADIEDLHLRLMGWFADLGPGCQYKAPNQVDMARTGASLSAHLALLHTSFHNTISTLHRFHAIPPHQSPSTFTSREQGADSWNHVCQASQAISNISRDLYCNKIDRFLPTTLSTMQFAPILTQIARLSHESSGNQRDALQNIFYCAKVVETQRNMYPSADWSAGLIAKMLSKGQIAVLKDSDEVIYGLSFRGITYDSRKKSDMTFKLPLTTTSEVHPKEKVYGGTLPASYNECVAEAEHTANIQLQSSWDSSMLQEVVSPGYRAPLDGTGQHHTWHDSSTLSDDWMEMLFDFEDSCNTFLDVF